MTGRSSWCSTASERIEARSVQKERRIDLCIGLRRRHYTKNQSRRATQAALSPLGLQNESLVVAVPSKGLTHEYVCGNNTTPISLSDRGSSNEDKEGASSPSLLLRWYRHRRHTCTYVAAYFTETKDLRVLLLPLRNIISGGNVEFER